MFVAPHVVVGSRVGDLAVGLGEHVEDAVAWSSFDGDVAFVDEAAESVEFGCPVAFDGFFDAVDGWVDAGVVEAFEGFAELLHESGGPVVPLRCGRVGFGVADGELDVRVADGDVDEDG